MGIIAFGIMLYMLMQAKFVLISLAIAIILFSLTADAINSIARMRIGSFRVTNWLASVFAVLLISSLLLALSALVLSQLNTVLSTTVNYAEQAQFAIAELFSFMGEDVEQAVLATVRSIEITGYLRTAAGQAGNLLSAVVLIILFVAFLFAERVWFSTKLVNLLGDSRQADRVGRIIGSIVRNVNYYLLVKTFVSAVTGLMVFFVCSLFSLEFAGAMGILTFMLNYIPNLGSIIATVVVALVAFVQEADPSLALLVFVSVGVLQFLVGNVIDPMLMGRALRLSSFGIIISLAFWGLVWGVPGMFLAVPIMVGLMIVCSHIPQLRPVAILLSREGLPETEMFVPQEPEPPQNISAPRQRAPRAPDAAGDTGGDTRA
ncbi:AI-2E family transporter [Alkalilacustris brevis]|uniref:AI-2E family transporter n=1 Tax=Alkalilacustris brevis TaxID=2026338 RepID=UPI000E0DC1C1|nr:AI-2E family transporter [Alkalilacustris brevis]